MRKILTILLIIFLCVGDIFLFRVGILPFEPSLTLLPLFLIISILYNTKYLQYFFSNKNSNVFIFYVILSICYSIISSFNDIWYTITNHIITLLLYCTASLFFLRSNNKYNAFIFLSAFVVLATSILYDLIFGGNSEIRGAGFAENPNNAALRLILIYIVLTCFIESKKFMILLTFSCFIFVFLTLSRSGIVLFALSSILILPVKFAGLKKIKELPRVIIRIVPILLIFTFVFLSLIPQLTKLIPAFEHRAAAERISQITGQNSIVSDSDVDEGRVSIANNYLEYFVDNPLGYGTGMSMNRDFYYKATHNMFLRVAIDYGLIGLIILLVFLAKGIIKAVNSNDFYSLAFYTVALLTCFFTNSLFENRTFIICLAFIGIKAGLTQYNKKVA